MGKLRGKTAGILCLLPWLCLVLPSCLASKSVSDYRLVGFHAKVTWTVQEETVVADVRSLPAEGEAVYTFLQPEALAGIEWQKKDGVWQIRCGEMTEDKICPNAWLDYAHLAMPEGVWHTVGKTEWRGISAVYAEITHTSEEGEKQVYEVYLARESGTPLAIQTGELSLVWEEFQIIS